MIERQLSAGPGRVAHVRFTDRSHGDFSVEGPADSLARARQSVSPYPWTWLRQVHGATVVDVDRPGAGAGREGDATVSSALGAALAVQTADCAPIALVGDGAVAMVHAGWRGVVAGVVPQAVATVRQACGGELTAVIGPLIRPDHYEFHEPELDSVIDVVGETARATTLDGEPALDLAAAVTSALKQAGVDVIEDLGVDTSDPRYFSLRCRGETARQVGVAWLEPR